MTEKELTKQVCNYIKLQYPSVYFFTDPSGMFNPHWSGRQQLKANRSTHAQLDLIILEPKGNYNGLIIELKREGERVFKKDGSMASEHLKEQNESIILLMSKGYSACFAIGFEAAKSIIDRYMSTVTI
jgi:hypothetical protein